MQTLQAVIVRGHDEADVVREANKMLDTGRYRLPMKPVAISHSRGAGPYMAIVLECLPEKT